MAARIGRRRSHAQYVSSAAGRSFQFCQTVWFLECADSETLPFWAIGAFAGLRRAEIERLAWNEIDFEAGVIEVKESKSKTASRRLVTIQPNLYEWLAPYRTH